MANVGLSHDDFYRCTIEELEEIFRRWEDRRESDIRTSWEQMRLHAVMTMQPHCKKRLNAKTILPFPWEAEPKTPKAEPVDWETAKAQMKKRMKK